MKPTTGTTLIELGPRALTIAQAAQIMRDAVRTQGVWVYAIQAGEDGPIKVGITTGPPAKRLKTLQQGNPERLRGIAAWRSVAIEERQIHKEFASVRMHGEWFRPTDELRELVLALGGDFEDWAELQDRAA